MKRKIISLFLFQISIFLLPSLVDASLYISEVAWMGSSENANAEWIEIYNGGSLDVDVSGWTLSGSVSITINQDKSLVSGGYFVLERTSDDTLPYITADQIYTGALANTGGSIVLKNKNGEVVDELVYLSGWPAGDNNTKETMQKFGTSWYTSGPTPKSPTSNSVLNTNNQIQNNNNEIKSSHTTNIINNTNTSIQKSAYRDISAKIILNQNTIPKNVAQDFRVIVYGNYGEVLEKGKVVWNFGDGNTKESSSFETVNHKYKYPGEYTVSLQYFKNSNKTDYDAEALATIKVVKGELSISGIGDDTDPYIEIENKSSYEISLKDWKLVANGKIFTFPSGTYIKSGRKNIFDLDALGFHKDEIKPLFLFRPGFELESVYPANYSFTKPNIQKNSNNDSIQNESTKEGKTEIFDFNSIENQEANSISSKRKIPPFVVFLAVMMFSMFLVLYIRRIKNNKIKDEIENLNIEDIKIIE